MIWNKLPFIIVLIATILPWMAAIVDAKWITYVPFFLSLLAYFIYETRKHSKILQISYGFLFVFFVISISVSWQLAQGLGIGSGGTLIIITLTFIYLKFFISTQFGIPAQYLIKQIHIIYAIHVIFILCELVFRFAGGTDIIVSLVGNASEVAKYKMYNKAKFLRYIGFKDMTGLGGLLLGSQSASQVTLFAVFLFAPFYRNNTLYQYNRRAYIWFFLSIMAFLVSITMMASILAVIFLFIIFFYLPNSKYKNISSQIVLITILIIFFIPISQIVLFNITNAHDYFIYYNAFYASIDSFMQLDPITKFFGMGKHAGQIMHSQLQLTPNTTIADFGLGMLFNQSGILLMGAAIFVLIKIFIQVQRSVAHSMKLSFNRTTWIWLGTVNSLLALGWGLSLIHYTPAIELGGRELFAFHLAVCLLAVKNMKRQIVSVIPSAYGK